MPTALVPHQHTNVGRWREAEPASRLRPVCAIGLLVGQHLNAPHDAELAKLAATTCSVHVALHYIHESSNKRVGRQTARVLVYGCRADGSALPPVEAAKVRRSAHATAAATRVPGGPVGSGSGTRVQQRLALADDAALFNFSSQRRYHDVNWLDGIDVALLWPPDRYPHSSPNLSDKDPDTAMNIRE
ncbi:hypothetical protein T492DRAFT_1072670 [Pavlovales sp. CCMP2436]|nr:hypothetical protein T492DRAFT_1072670 [Pavlovales sp. CCMP2436]